MDTDSYPDPDTLTPEKRAGRVAEILGRGGPHYLDRDGKPLELIEWARLFEDMLYRFIANTTIGHVRVSTIWTGHNINFFGPPTIFESMVFGGPRHLNEERYATKEQAQLGHYLLCDHVRCDMQAQTRRKRVRLRKAWNVYRRLPTHDGWLRHDDRGLLKRAAWIRRARSERIDLLHELKKLRNV